MINSISTSFVSTLLGKLLGFLKIVFIGNYLGVSAEIDAFFFALSLIMLWEVIFVTGIFSTLFVKEYNDSGNIMVRNYLVSSLFYSLLFIALVLYFSVPLLFEKLSEYNFSFDYANTQLISNYIQSMSLLFILAVLVQVPTLIHQANERYSISTLNPIIWNLSQISYFLGGFYWGVTVEGLIWAMLAGYALSVLLQFLTLKKREYSQFSIFAYSIPRWISISVAIGVLSITFMDEASNLISMYFLSDLGIGEISSYSYASRVVKLASALISASIVMVFFNRLSKASNSHLDMFYLFVRIAVVISLSSVSLISIFAPISSLVVLGEYSDRFLEYVLYFVFYILVFSLMLLLHRFSVLMNRSNGIIALVTLSIFLNVLLNLIFIDRFGSKFVMISNILSYLFLMTALCVKMDVLGGLFRIIFLEFKLFAYSFIVVAMCLHGTFYEVNYPIYLLLSFMGLILVSYGSITNCYIALRDFNEGSSNKN